MAEIILGPHNGVQIRGTRPRRPKTRKKHPLKSNSTVELMAADDIQQNDSSEQAVAATEHQSHASLTPLQRSQSDFLAHIHSNQWEIKRRPDNSYSITISSIQSVTEFMHMLGELAFSSTLYTSPVSSPADTEGSSRSSSPDNHTLVRRRPVRLPYIKYHSELYAETLWEARDSVDSPLYYTALSSMIDDSIHYFMECMNHYYPVRPRALLREWFNKLERPSEDPFALAISTFWCRHLLIHHRPANLVDVDDGSRLIDILQHKLAAMTRDALGEHFDEPSVEIIFALCLCNMTTVFALDQKAIFHMMAVRMAIALGIKPKSVQDNSDKAELNNRIWWYLYQIDHFLHESGAIQVSMLEPHSDDHDALSRLIRPMPCSLDDPNEAAGVLEWAHVLELWIIRRQIVKGIEAILDRGENLNEGVYHKVHGMINDWCARIPPEIRKRPLQVDSRYSIALLETCLTVRMEQCTNMCLILHHFCPHQDTPMLTPLERRAVLDMIECSTEMLRLRRTVVDFTPCQTWPGDLKRSIEILIYCTRYKDNHIRDRAKLGLVHARNLLKQINEVKWKDPICMVLIQDVENVLCAVSTDSIHQPVLPKVGETEEKKAPSRSIKMANNMYTGVMMFDRELQPRAKYYKPANTSEPLGNVTVFENVSRYMSS